MEYRINLDDDFYEFFSKIHEISPEEKRSRDLVKFTALQEGLSNEERRFPLPSPQEVVDNIANIKEGYSHNIFEILAWMMLSIQKINPIQHVDISPVITLSSILSTNIPVSFYEYSPACLYGYDSKWQGHPTKELTIGKVDLNRLPFADNSIPSLSCLRLIERIGLGHHGEPLDPDGDRKAIFQLKRVIQEGGYLCLSVPLGKQHIQFNDRRVYSYPHFLRYFPEFELIDYTLVRDTDEAVYGYGCFLLQKTRADALPPTSGPTTAIGRTLPIATSIAPRDITTQQRAIWSWVLQGFHIISFNIPSEIESLKDHFPFVEFVAVSRDASQPFGKPYVYLHDILAYYHRSDHDLCGIVNSDIHFFQDIRWFIEKEAPGSMVFGSRVDIERIDNPIGSIEKRGLDYFFFDKKIASLYPDEGFCLGLPWWDYWILLIPIYHQIPLKYIGTPFGYHVYHPQRWNVENWYYFKDIILKHVEQPPLENEDNIYHFGEVIYQYIMRHATDRFLPYRDCRQFGYQGLPEEFIDMPFYGWIPLGGFRPMEGPYPQWDLPTVLWSYGPSSFLQITTECMEEKSYRLRMTARSTKDEQTADLFLDGNLVGTHTFTSHQVFEKAEFSIKIAPEMPKILELRYRPWDLAEQMGDALLFTELVVAPQ
ncbi:DUF268 domain-containing protein [Heliobacterium gestii]|uniref:DUF268 domain-containing protein n=1 Tax=Heliomicrobium gestii TaxID=2699 RepID=A0A845LA15_HELGE|nr:DUF268 domain-containing protein [Heliomicrobium gestii]MBM7865254.1 hypothetical protein [Heliomicrobium gestii]MZP41519.1 DUF268 domain-containing protein [Heliomicrobium gestii]